MNCSMPGFPVLHHLLELTQTHAHQVGDAIQPSHSLSPPSLPALSLLQHQSFPVSRLFASGGHSIGASVSASVLPMNIQADFLEDGLVCFLPCPRDSQESSLAPLFKSINSLAFSLLYSPSLTSQVWEYQTTLPAS